MNIAIVGLGYVGLTSAACLIEQGHFVVGVDVDPERVSLLNSGKSPINEPGVEDRLKQGLNQKTFFATNDVCDAVNKTDFAFVCVGTPSSVSGAHDMSFIKQVSNEISSAISKSEPKSQPYEVIYRSTMAPGSIENIIIPIFCSESLEYGNDVTVYHHPEFLRESSAVKDYYNPPKIVIGAQNANDLPIFGEIYKDINATTYTVGYRESELIKFVDNSFHALKVSFGNEIGRICKTLNVNIEQVMDLFLSDTKLNISSYYLRPGGPFGGSCLPKDVRALEYLCNSNGLKCEVLSNINVSNASHKQFLLGKTIENLEIESDILVVGLSFKKNTDDLRESPQVDLVQDLIGLGYKVSIYEPDLNIQDITANKSNISHLFSKIISLDEAASKRFNRVVYTKDLNLESRINADTVIRLDVL
jgi:GDP-mannose 6-dehydrogenase